MSNMHDDAFNQWWNGIENFATRAERLDEESPEAIAKAAFFAAIAASNPETQAQATNEHTEQSERAELIEWLNQSADQAAIFPSTAHEAKRYRQAAALLAADKAVGEEWLQGACDKIEEALHHHKLSEQTAEDGESFQLLDALSHSNDTSTGEREIETLVDTIYFALKDYAHPQPSALPDDVVKDAERYLYYIESSPNGEMCFMGECYSGKKALDDAIDAAMLKEEK